MGQAIDTGTYGKRFQEPRLLDRWDVLFGFWTLYGLIHVGSALVVQLVDGRPVDGPQTLWRLVSWYAWVPTSRLVFELARRVPIDRARLVRSLPVHLAGAVFASLFTSFLNRAAQGLAAMAVGQTFDLGEAMREAFTRYLVFDATLYFTLVAVAHAFDYHQRYREREVQASQLRAALMQAQLQALKMQLHPHFFFNALHTIAMLVRQHQEEQAIDVIAGLGDLFRYVLDHSETQVVQLKEEIDFLYSYLAIEQVRFRDRLDVHLDVDPRALEAHVPVLLLQPLVENALRHGIEASGRPGRLVVRVRRQGTRLRIQVQDNGSGLPEGWRIDRHGGIGLSNTRARLERLYGSTFHLSFAAPPEGGTAVTLAFPHRLEGVPFAVPAASGQAPGLPQPPVPSTL